MPLLLDQPKSMIDAFKEFDKYVEFIENLDRIVGTCGIEEKVMIAFLQAAQEKSPDPLSPRRQRSIQKKALMALRAAILRKIRRQSLREFCLLLADSTLSQWFVGINRFFKANVPSPQTLSRWESELTKDITDSLNDIVIAAATKDGSLIGKETGVSLTELFTDSTCVEANIHYPVDWLLFRDAARTLMLLILRVREKGVRNRLPRMPRAPRKFIAAMNALAQKMHYHSRRKDAAKFRKKTLRKMIRLLKTVEGHAIRHRDALLDDAGKPLPSDLSTVLSFNAILEQIDGVIHQARERIIGGRAVKNCDKILSLYDPFVNVVCKGKSGKKTEFGNVLQLVELLNGLIVDYDLIRDGSPGDPSLLIKSMDRLIEKYGADAFDSVCGDRGYDSPTVRERLKELGIENSIASRSPKALAEQLTDGEFRERLKRRSQTEARIAILKNCFLGSPMLQRGFDHRESHVALSVLSHNLWLLARLACAPAVDEAAEDAA